jgi:YihY family inner membrane protein
MKVDDALDRVDGYQRDRTWLAIPYAIIKRFGELDVGKLAAALSYYGFFSLFPLLLVLSSVAGYVLHDRPDLQSKVLDSALAQFPVVGPQLKQNVGSIQGSGIGVLVGLALAMWAGIGAIRAAQTAMDTVWDVPRKQRPNTPKSIGLALLTLLVLAAFIATAAIVAWLGGQGGLVGRSIATVVTLVANVGFFMLGYRVLTTADVSWRQVLPGGVIAGVGWTALLMLGGWIVSNRIQSSGHVYGTFALVIGLLGWLYLGAQLSLFGAVADVVIENRLWPRSLRGELTDADRRALRRSADQEERRQDEAVDVSFERPREDRSPRPGS